MIELDEFRIADFFLLGSIELKSFIVQSVLQLADICLFDLLFSKCNRLSKWNYAPYHVIQLYLIPILRCCL